MTLPSVPKRVKALWHACSRCLNHLGHFDERLSETRLRYRKQLTGDYEVNILSSYSSSALMLLDSSARERLDSHSDMK